MAGSQVRQKILKTTIYPNGKQYQFRQDVGHRQPAGTGIAGLPGLGLTGRT
jgi:hypothetical protein